MLLEVEFTVCVLLDHLEDLDRFRDNLAMSCEFQS